MTSAPKKSRRFNAPGKKRRVINSIQFGDPGSPELLKTISSQSGGLYRFVAEPEDERGIDQDLSVHLLGSWCDGERTPTPSSVAAAESTLEGTISKFDISGITIRDTFVPWVMCEASMKDRT